MNTPTEIKLTELPELRETFGQDSRAINRHAIRIYADQDGNRYMLDRTLDGVPPFFSACSLFRVPGHEDLWKPERLAVYGQSCWGDGLSWPVAEAMFFAWINSTEEPTTSTEETTR